MMIVRRFLAVITAILVLTLWLASIYLVGTMAIIPGLIGIAIGILITTFGYCIIASTKKKS